MPTSLTFSEHLDALETSGGRLAVRPRGRIGRRSADVPGRTTDDSWPTRRWSTVGRPPTSGGDDPDVIPSQTEIRTTVDDLVGYYRDGHGALLASFHDAAPDLEVMTFLKDAPAPRDFSGPGARPTKRRST